MLLCKKEPGLGGAFSFIPSMAALSLVRVGSHFWLTSPRIVPKVLTSYYLGFRVSEMCPAGNSTQELFFSGQMSPYNLAAHVGYVISKLAGSLEVNS